jgi:hypothetical protein
LAVSFALFTLAAGCVPTYGAAAPPVDDGLPGVPLNPSPRPLAPRAPETVAIFTTGRPPRPYHEVRLFKVGESGYYDALSDGDLLHWLRRLGGRVGCDGVVVVGATGEIAADAEGADPRTLNQLRATCIVYDDGPEAAASGGQVRFAPPPPPAPAPPADGVYVVRDAPPPGLACASVGSGVERGGSAPGFAWLLEGRLRRRAAAAGATHLVLGAPSPDERGGARALGGRFLRCAPAAPPPAAPAAGATEPAPAGATPL